MFSYLIFVFSYSFVIRVMKPLSALLPSSHRKTVRLFVCMTVSCVLHISMPRERTASSKFLLLATDLKWSVHVCKSVLFLMFS